MFGVEPSGQLIQNAMLIMAAIQRTNAPDMVSELDPANAHKTFYNIGVLIEKNPDLSEADTRRAIEAYRKAVEAKPDYAPAHRSLGYALMRLGELPEAKKELARYVELDPSSKDAAEIKAVLASLP